MDVKTIKDKIALNREKLRIANSNGDYKKKQKIQNQISILNFKLEIETIKNKIKQLRNY
tara:strand:+ start:198 stop:374 length:177 start_codon:yes stop_codon:yes gene_type:complete